MRPWLLLVSGGVGIARSVVDISVSDGMPELEADRLQVGRVTVNAARNGDLAISAQQGARVALRLLFRELGRNRSLAHLEVATEAPGATVTGRSSELLFGLAVFLHLARRDRLAVFPVAQFAATGTLDPLGNVGSVEGVAAKITAALASELPAGGFLFYPGADDDQVSSDLHRQCQARGVHLRPVDRIDDALIDLDIPVQGGWPGSPFRSLEPFNHEHARIFFGRQAEVTALAARLDQRAAAGRPGALVIGASGAGKSSFCMAGLLLALAKGTPTLEHAIWRPRDAIAGKSDTDIGEVDIARSLIAGWRRRDENQTGFSFAAVLPDSEDLATLAASLPDDALAHHPHVWVVDQFEELFTLGFSAETRIAFANFLRDLQARGLWIIGTLRSEFYGQYLDLRDGDGDALLIRVFDDDGVFNLPRMGRDALHQVIIRPAELAGLRFETRATDGIRLDNVVLVDALATDDALPLLGFTLQQLYDALERGEYEADPAVGQPRTLTFAAYEALGGLKGAIGKIVEPRFALLDDDARAALPGLLSALAVPSGDGLRETARPASIAQWPAGSPGRRLIDTLIAIRVLVSEQASTPGSPPQIRVAHEALFSHWDEARRVLGESQQTRLQIEDFRQRAETWNSEGRPPGALLTSPRDIENAKNIQYLAPQIHTSSALYDFVNESISFSNKSRSRRRRRIAALLLSSVAAATAFAGLAWWSFERAEGERVQRIRAQQATARARKSADKVSYLEGFFEGMFDFAKSGGDDKAKFEALKSIANSGDHEAIYNLGVEYETGENVHQDWSKADALIEKAAALGDMSAEYAIGKRFVYGDRRSVDEAKAREFFEKSAAQGDTYAQYDLGIMSEYGIGGRKDIFAAINLFRLAAIAGDADAQEKLGEIYLFGRGVPKNIKISVKYFKMSSDSGSALAQVKLGSMYTSGELGKKDNVRARGLFGKAAENKDIDGEISLAIMLYFGKGGPKDQKEAIRLLRVADSQQENGPSSVKYAVGSHLNARVILRELGMRG